ncbi:MAG TPA: hypothetical protein VFB45_25215 [Pseudolabrys sp.]|nr:hypothetical protein [Pseudolabrys sp.]
MNRIIRIVLVASVAGLCGIALGAVMAPRVTLASYLAAIAAVASLPLGALVVLMTTYLVPGRWVELLHVPLTGAALSVPVAGLLFVPLLIGAPWLYSWAYERETLGAFKAIYLTSGFFAIRTVIYFVIWTALALWAQRAWGDLPRMKRMASIGLIVWSLTVSFAGIDWLESLDPHFHSSIYGLLYLGFVMLTGVAFAVLFAALIVARRVERAGYGGFLLSLLLLWAYLHAMQYIVIWAGDIPEEVVWYQRRGEGGWGIVTIALFMLQFVVPFFALLSERVRGGRNTLVFFCALTLLMRVVEAEWLALPDAHVASAWLIVSIPATLLVAGAAWFVAFNVLLLREQQAVAPSGAAAIGS